jgi:hypothetical protein
LLAFATVLVAFAGALAVARRATGVGAGAGAPRWTGAAGAVGAGVGADTGAAAGGADLLRFSAFRRRPMPRSLAMSALLLSGCTIGSDGEGRYGPGVRATKHHAAAAPIIDAPEINPVPASGVPPLRWRHVAVTGTSSRGRSPQRPGDGASPGAWPR